MSEQDRNRRFLGNCLAERLAAGTPLVQQGIQWLLRGWRELGASRQQEVFWLWKATGGGLDNLSDPQGRVWRELAAGYALPESMGEKKGLVASSMPGSEILLVVQTYFALVVKLLVRIWLGRPHLHEDAIPPIPDPQELTALEEGRCPLGRWLGLDGSNPFGWYLQTSACWKEAFWPQVLTPLSLELENIVSQWRPPWKEAPAKPFDSLSGQRCSPAKKNFSQDSKLSEKEVGAFAERHGRSGWSGIRSSAQSVMAEWADRLFRDHFQRLYEAMLPRSVRRRWGEYLTPDALARHGVELVGYPRNEQGRLLDPTCGSGSFLMAALYAAWKNAFSPSDVSADQEQEEQDISAGSDASPSLSGGAFPVDRFCRAMERIVGWDRSALAVLTARANWLLAASPWMESVQEIPIPILRQDVLLPSGLEESSPTHPPETDHAETFDFIVGNPPWLIWDHLEQEYREATRPLWREYGLFSLSAKEGRHGGAKKDLAGLITYVVADRYLKPGGRLALLLPSSLFHTQAGDGFRRFRLPDGTPLKVLGVEDFCQVRLFRNSAQRTAALVVEKGRPTVYPTPYIRWRPTSSDPLGSNREAKKEKTSCPPKQQRPPKSLHLDLESHGVLKAEHCLAEPITPDRPTSAWLVRPIHQESVEKPSLWQFSSNRSRGDESGESASQTSGRASEGTLPTWRRWIGPADYVAYLGANTGGANEVFWFDWVGTEEDKVQLRNRPSRRRVARGEQTRFLGDSLGDQKNGSTKPSLPMGCCSSEIVAIEPDLLFPLVRWQDVHRWQALPSCWILLVQDVERRRGVDPDWLREHCPATWEYLKRWEDRLRRRAAYQRYQAHGPFYSLYNVGPYTLSPYKVVWRRMDRQIRAAVLTPMPTLWGCRPIVPQETCTFIPTENAEEAYYLTALLNSDWIHQLVQATGLTGTKGFGSPGMLRWLRLPRFNPKDAHHQQLAQLAQSAHFHVQQEKKTSDLEAQIAALIRQL